MAFGEQLFVDEQFEHENQPALFEKEVLAMLALNQTVELN